MKIKNKRSFFSGILYLMLSLIIIGILILQEFSFKIMITGIFSIIMSWVSFTRSTFKEGMEEELMKTADERDVYNAMISAQTTLRIANEICLIVAIAFLAIYGITKTEFFFVSAITLCLVIILMFVVLFIVNGYFEKNN